MESIDDLVEEETEWLEPEPPVGPTLALTCPAPGNATTIPSWQLLDKKNPGSTPGLHVI